MAHSHEFIDPDGVFSIDPTTREISTNDTKIILMQYDHNSEVFTFSIPRFVEGHDMSLCNKIEIHYINVNKRTKEQSKDVYPVTDQKVDGDNLVFTWLVSGKSTKYSGTLSFIIRFCCIEDGTISYMWHTNIFKNITVYDGLSNTESIAEDYSDILENWKRELVELGTDYSNISNAPVKYIKSPDSNGNTIVIRDLDSGTYVLDGVFYLFKTDTSSQAAIFKYGFPAVIGKTDAKTYVQVLYPPKNTIQYVEVTDDGFYQNNINLATLKLEPFTIRIEVGWDAENSVYSVSCDKTYSEINDAITNGENCQYIVHTSVDALNGSGINKNANGFGCIEKGSIFDHSGNGETNTIVIYAYRYTILICDNGDILIAEV